MRRENGSGSIRQRGDGWEGRLTIGTVEGRQKRRSVYGRTQREVEAKLEALRRDLDIGTVLAGPRLTVAHYLRDWLKVKRHGTRESTWRRYVGLVENNIIPTIGHVPLVKLTPTAVERMTADALDYLSPRTAHHMRAVLRTALNRAVKHGLVTRNVAALADAIRVPRQERPILSPVQVKALLRMVDGDRLAAIYWLAVSTGLRRGELLAMRWEDVDLDAGTIRVSHAAREAKTQDSARLLSLPGAVLPVLRRHRAGQEMERRVAQGAWAESGLVFTRPDGQRLYGTLLHREWTHWARLLKVPHVHFHDLRHSANSLLSALGVDARTRMAILGHSNLRTTDEVYGHLVPELMQDAAERMSHFLEDVS